MASALLIGMNEQVPQDVIILDFIIYLCVYHAGERWDSNPDCEKAIKLTQTIVLATSHSNGIKLKWSSRDLRLVS